MAAPLTPSHLTSFGVDVLLVDPSEKGSTVLTQHIREAFAEVHVRLCQSTHEAAALLKAFSFDAIVLSQSIPETYGHASILALLLEIKLDVPVIIISDSLSPKDSASALVAGATDYIHRERAQWELPPALKRDVDAMRTRRKVQLLEAEHDEVKATLETLRQAANAFLTASKPTGFSAVVAAILGPDRKRAAWALLFLMIIMGFLAWKGDVGGLASRWLGSAK